MGLGESDQPAAEKRSASAEIYCSICLDAVSPGGDRSTARLQCGHEFHLDCIGSAFNAKGVMQCPNCREIGRGNWLYANGSRSLPGRSFGGWTRDEDLYDFNYTQMPFGVHWCPFSRLARVLPSFDISSRSTGTFMPTVAPPYFNSQPHPPVRDNPPNVHNPLSVHRTTFSGPQRSGVRGLPATSHHTPLDPTNYYLFPSTASSSRGSQESESRRSDHLARDGFAPLPLLPVDRDTTWWMSLPQSAGLPDSRSMWGFWHRNGSERPSSRGMREGSSDRPSPVSRMRPYN